MPLASSSLPLPPRLANLLVFLLNLSPSLPVPFRSHFPALRLPPLLARPSSRRPRPGPSGNQPPDRSQATPTTQPDHMLPTSCIPLSLLTSLRSLLAFPFRPRPFLHPSSPCRACPGRDPGRGPSTMRNPGAPKPPLATRPDQMLPTSYSPTHSSALYPLPFPNTPTRQKNPPKLSLASRPPLGAGWPETVPPFTPPDFRRRPPALSPAHSPCPPRIPSPKQQQPTRHPRGGGDPAATTHQTSPRPPLATQPDQMLPTSYSPLAPSPTHPAPPQEFLGRNSYCARAPHCPAPFLTPP